MTLKDLSILIVEDDSLIALHLQELLQNSGYEVPDPVASGEEAIEYVRTCPIPDLILMDVTLDGKLDGIETARQIWKSIDVPIIFLTAHSDTNRLASAEDLAACKVIGKPFLWPDVISAIEGALHDVRSGP
jgi:CheY-like chemotaxis protein